MARWTDTSHAMRRRMGAPSNHHESAGNSMARNHMTPEEVLASAEHANSGRRYMGLDATNFNNESGTPEVGTLMPKKNVQASDPTAGGKANRSNIPAGNAAQSERMGARYRTDVRMAPMIAPEAGPTMGSAKMVASIAGRQNPNFEDGMQSVL